MTASLGALSGTPHMITSGTPNMWAHAYMLRVGGVSPWDGIEQIRKSFHPKRTIPSKREICPSTVIMSTISLVRI